MTLVARQLHVVARIAAGRADDLALRDQRVLDAPEHLLVADPSRRMYSLYSLRMSRTSSFSRSSMAKLFGDDRGDQLRNHLRFDGSIIETLSFFTSCRAR